MSFIYNAGTSGIYNESDEFMAGQIAYCAAGVIPSGWLECNGAAISRATYGTLFAAIGTNYGAGDGATTFNLPDLRGEFLRGADRGRGVDAGRAIGSAQGDAIRNISGSITTVTKTSVFEGAAGAFTGSSNKKYANLPSIENPDSPVIYPQTANFDASTVVPTAAENRPRNVAVLTIIKYS
ncbi:phage tail protein [Comamonas sp. Z3]|uniref:phage tail protein n=1 Tax=Comamonas sp. Z3 TaxID=2601247 RepID=UPI0021063363|nr:phage tail protein [Comamonas sp. Z3]